MRETSRDGVPGGRDETLKNPAVDHSTYYYGDIVQVKKNVERIEREEDGLMHRARQTGK
jgi:hypothetical protein